METKAFTECHISSLMRVPLLRISLLTLLKYSGRLNYRICLRNITFIELYFNSIMVS